jgi:hypothetical protein
MIDHYIWNASSGSAVETLDSRLIADYGNQLRLQAAIGTAIDKRLQVGAATGNQYQ